MKYYIQIKHFSDASFAKSSFSVLKGYFIQLKDILLKHYLFLAIIALVFFIIKQIKKREITKELVLLIIGNSLSFLILLFTPANPRYLLSFLFLICLIIAIIIFDLFVLIYKKEKKLKFNNAFFLFIILLFLLVLTYKGNVKTLYYHSSLTERFYSEGLIVPERSIIKIDEIINLIKNKMNQLAGNRILVLSTTENAYLILTRLKYEKAYEINDDLFCITRSDIKNVSDDCRLNEKTMDYCNYEIVIDFDIHVDDDEKKMLEIKFPERMKMASMIISNWEKCKKNYNLIDSITDKRLETNKNITVYIYEKKLT